jgi:hypothetical protein
MFWGFAKVANFSIDILSKQVSPHNAKPLLVAGAYCFGLIGIQISSS